MKKLILTIVITAFAGTSYADTQTFSQIGDEQAFNAALSAIKQTPHTDAIAEAIFDNQFALTALNPEEMNETEGAFAWGTLGSGALAGASFGVATGNLYHYIAHGSFASLESNLISATAGAATGGLTGLGAAAAAAAAGKTLTQVLTEDLSRLAAYHAIKTELAINAATFPWQDSNPNNP